MKDTILNKNEPIPRQAVISNLHFRYMTSASGDTKTASSMKCYLYYISTEGEGHSGSCQISKIHFFAQIIIN